MTQQVYETKPHTRVYVFSSGKILELHNITTIVEHDNFFTIYHKYLKKDDKIVRTVVIFDKLDYIAVGE